MEVEVELKWKFNGSGSTIVANCTNAKNYPSFGNK